MAFGAAEYPYDAVMDADSVQGAISDAQDKRMKSLLKKADPSIKFGVYVVGKYSVSDRSVPNKAGEESNGGFDLRFVRLYLNGYCFQDFYYRLQMEVNDAPGTDKGPRVVDAFVEWQKFDFAQIKLNRAIEAYRKSAGCLFVREGIAEIGAQEVREEVRQHLRLRGKRPVVMVDYLQILKPADPRASDKQNTDRAVVELKRISRDFDLPVVAISSFNRENYRSAVSMEAFKESGAVEYSSDVLLGLQLAGAGEQGFDVNAAKTRNPRQVELVILKNRNGSPYGRIPYAYHAAYGYFSELRSSFRP